jgi:hypothetical protein
MSMNRAADGPCRGFTAHGLFTSLSTTGVERCQRVTTYVTAINTSASETTLTTVNWTISM